MLSVIIHIYIYTRKYIYKYMQDQCIQKKNAEEEIFDSHRDESITYTNIINA